MKDIEPFYVELGHLIQHKRNENEMSQDYLGQQLNPKMTRASIANIEAGKQRVLAHTLVQLSEALKADLKDLIPAHTAVHSPKQQPLRNKVESELTRKLALPKKELKKIMVKINSTNNEEK